MNLKHEIFSSFHFWFYFRREYFAHGKITQVGNKEPGEIEK